MKNSQVTDSKKCDIDCYRNICEETQLEKNSMDTIHGSGQLKNEEIAVSKSCSNNYYKDLAKDNNF